VSEKKTQEGEKMGDVLAKKQILSQPGQSIYLTIKFCDILKKKGALKDGASLELLGGMHFPQNVLKKEFWPSPPICGHIKTGEIYVVAETRCPISILALNGWYQGVTQTHGHTGLDIQLHVFYGGKMVAEGSPSYCFLIGKLPGK
jgi:hypothetical protein